VSTWGRESRQYNDARGIMLSYLEENLSRLGSAGGGDREGGEDGGEPDRVVEKGIAELMEQLRIWGLLRRRGREMGWVWDVAKCEESARLVGKGDITLRWEKASTGLEAFRPLFKDRRI
jgi:hypothetical protein